MSKLIYSPTSALIEGSYAGIRDTDQTVNTVYYSIAFTGDGYLYTHGKKFRLFQITNNGVDGISFSIVNGTAAFSIDGTVIGQGTVISSVSGDNIVCASTSNGTVSLTHKEYLNINSATTYGSNVKIPIITVDKYGHITTVSEGNTIDPTKVQAGTTSTAGNYYLTGVVDSNAQNPIYNTNVYFDENGNLYANNIYYNGQAISGQFAPLSHTSVKASDSVLGHVNLADAADNSKDVSAWTAATPKAVYAAIGTAKQYAEDLVAAQDAMIFVGTLTSAGIIHSHNSNVLTGVVDDTSSVSAVNYKVGWTFRFTSAGTFNGEDVEAGDMMIAIKDRDTTFDMSDWTVIQTNINGALTATNNLSGILYANNSRNIQALAFGNGILKSDGATISFVNPNTTWRDIQVNSTSIGTTALNLIAGTNVSLTEDQGAVTIGINTSNIIGSSASLTLSQDNVAFVYNPSAASTLNIGNLLTLAVDNGTYTLKHATISAVTNAFGRITTDGYGHVTSVDTVSYLPNQYSFKIKNSTSDLLEYDGSAAKVLKVLNGTDISLALAVNGTTNELELTPSITHKYRAVQFFGTSSAQSATVLIANNEDTILTLVAGDNIVLTHQDGSGQDLTDGTLAIHAEDTWRNVEAYKFISNVMSRSSIQDAALKFSDDFLFSSDEVGLCWTEIDENGRVTYIK